MENNLKISIEVVAPGIVNLEIHNPSGKAADIFTAMTHALARVLLKTSNTKELLTINTLACAMQLVDKALGGETKSLEIKKEMVDFLREVNGNGVQ